MNVVDTGKGDFEQPEPGSYPAVCSKVVDVGTQTSEFEGKSISRRKVMIAWELDEKMSDGKPFIIAQFYTAILSDKAKLRAHLEAWRGKPFTKDELAGFNLKTLLGTSCMLSLAQNDKGKIKVAGVSRVPKGLPMPTQTTPTVYFCLDTFEQGVFDSLSEGMRKMIIQAPEYRSLLSDVAAVQVPEEKLLF